MISTVYKGHQTVYPFKRCNVDVAMIGNHDLDWGVENMMDVINKTTIESLNLADIGGVFKPAEASDVPSEASLKSSLNDVIAGKFSKKKEQNPLMANISG